MAADTHAKGRIVLAVGKSVNQIRKIIANLDSEVADNAAGSQPNYLLPRGAKRDDFLPATDGVPVVIDSGPHILPGELLFLGIIPSAANTAADVDTTGATSDVYHIEYVDYDQLTKQKLPDQIVDETTRCTISGLAPATDPKLNQGALTFTHAWGPVPPGMARTIVGRLQVDLRSAA
ncbi:MAG: hypothetical protein QOG31_219 [Thermoplasmata archaeon]|jgi:hypothetical protein|nr:hypothetical protein [Thermoplasmata archaeon]